jgi:Fructosamine kinase
MPAATHSLRVPKVISWGDTKQGSYLATEHLWFGGRADQAELGRQLARMHKAAPKARFGACRRKVWDRVCVLKCNGMRPAHKACPACAGDAPLAFCMSGYHPCVQAADIGAAQPHT